MQARDAEFSCVRTRLLTTSSPDEITDQPGPSQLTPKGAGSASLLTATPSNAPAAQPTSSLTRYDTLSSESSICFENMEMNTLDGVEPEAAAVYDLSYRVCTISTHSILITLYSSHRRPRSPIPTLSSPSRPLTQSRLHLLRVTKERWGSVCSKD